MALIDKVPLLIKHIERNEDFLNYNKDIFDIREGDLLPKVIDVIHNQITDQQTASKMADRVPPINILNKVFNKLSTIYTKDVFRETENTKDLELVNQYAEKGVNDDFNDANQNYNSYKNTVLEIYEDDKLRSVQTRSLPSYLFLPYSDDPIDPTRMTVMIKYVGMIDDQTRKYWAYSDDEFVSFTSKGKVVTDDMLENEGVNPYGVIPFEYINQSRNLLIPKQDWDLRQMATLIPLLIGEINFGNQYLSMPIIYGVDIEAEDFSRNANTVMMVKSDNPEKTGNLSVLQPNLNISEQLKLVADQLAFWLSSKDVRAGSFAIREGETALSALALMIKEMDVTTNRDRQAVKFARAEITFWRKLATIHNALVDANRIDTKQKFSDENLTVTVRYSGQEAIETREDKVRRLSQEVDKGLNSRKRAIQELNPKMDEKIIDELVQEIEDDLSQIQIPTFNTEEKDNGKKPEKATVRV